MPVTNTSLETPFLTGDAPALQFLIPLYIYPSSWAHTFWDDLAANPDNIAYVIANPDSGPGASQNSDYVLGISKLRTAGIKILGYIDTNYAAIASATVEGQMDAWDAWYSIDGYYFDRANNVAGNESYYSTLNTYAKAKNSSWITVNGYGTTFPESFYTTADVHINTEETEANLLADSIPLLGWETGYPANHFGQLAHDCTSANVQADLDKIFSRHAYYCWLAEDPSYQTEPSYWTLLQKLVRELTSWFIGGLPPVLLIRERAPLRLSLDVTAPDGGHFRWASDEDLPTNVPSGLSFGSTMPGGFESMECTLPRKTGLPYSDLQEFSTITVTGVGNQIAWQGRLETSPRISGDQMTISPGAIGWVAALDDDRSAREIYVDIDMSKWTDITAARWIGYATAYNLYAPSVAADPASGVPYVATMLTTPWSRGSYSMAQYDARQIPIGSLYYAWKKGSSIEPYTDTLWHWKATINDQDYSGYLDDTGELRAGGPGSGTLVAFSTPQGDDRVWGYVHLSYDADSATWLGTGGTEYAIQWTCLAIYGDHGLTKRGSSSATTAQGFYASDIVAHAVGAWAPTLAVTRAGESTIEATSWVIPHLTFFDPTTPGEIIKDATRFGLEDWWVDEGPTFNLASRANHGRDWRARVGPSGLNEAGAQADRLWNSVIVSYRDVAGTTRTVGPTGSGADYIDDSLTDTSDTNPVTKAGLTRRAILSMGTSTLAGATKIGVAFLVEQAALSTAGRASFTGYLEDSSNVFRPVWQIRAGDRISFVDAADTTPRRVVRTRYNHDQRRCDVDLDSPPDALDALLQRMSVALIPLGMS